MIPVEQLERRTQERVIALFQEHLGYEYVKDQSGLNGIGNLDRERLRTFLARQKSANGHNKYRAGVIAKAIEKFAAEATKRDRALYDMNKSIYNLLRYGIKVNPGADEHDVTVYVVDWDNPENNDFAIAEEVVINGNTKRRPDIVLYVNGVALGVIELKRSTVDISEGIRQNIANQRENVILPFFSTVQYVMAGNDSQGLRYGAVGTPVKHYLTWKDDSRVNDSLDESLGHICQKRRFIELIHDFVLFDDSGKAKKLCRYNQYFGVKAAQKSILEGKSGIIWHAQGSGKSMTMFWLSKWIRENIPNSRVLIITDRSELDEQIQGLYNGVEKNSIYRTKSGADLIEALSDAGKPLICSLIHKFYKNERDSPARNGADQDDIDADISSMLPKNFSAEGNIHVFVDECHRTQSGKLHREMRKLLPGSVIIGFTGTPLLKDDYRNSQLSFGEMIHTYKLDEAIADGVVLDLRYEARDVDQYVTNPEKLDNWFQKIAGGMTEETQAKMRRKWINIQTVSSSKSRLDIIVSEIIMDFESRDRLNNNKGNAILVASSIYDACRYYRLFQERGFTKCAVITSYVPDELGAAQDSEQNKIYNKMLDGKKVDEFESEAKRLFVEEPDKMSLLIVVDKLLTGFDAPHATYLYIDKQMRDHGLFQAVCRVNRLDGNDKTCGYIIDYRDLFNNLESSISDYTSGPLGGYEKKDVDSLLSDHLKKAHEDIEFTRAELKHLCNPVAEPKGTLEYIHYFCAAPRAHESEIKANKPKRLALYRLNGKFLRAYSAIANKIADAGYSPKEQEIIHKEARHYAKLQPIIMRNARDIEEVLEYEDDMRSIIDTYIGAHDSKKIFELSITDLMKLVIEQEASSGGRRLESFDGDEAVAAETIENNLRLLIDENFSGNPKRRMELNDILDGIANERLNSPKSFKKSYISALLDKILRRRRDMALDYRRYLERVAELVKIVVGEGVNSQYPSTINTASLQALYDNLDKDEDLALRLDRKIRTTKRDDWRNNPSKRKEVKIAIKSVLGDSAKLEEIFELVVNQGDY